MAEGKSGMLQGFKEFVMRGNVIDVAVAFVIGAAFGALVKSFTEAIINPILAAFGGAEVGGFGFCINGADPCTAETATFINFGALLTAIIAFLITLAVVYFVFVVPINKAREMAKIVPQADETPDDVLLLQEIRDLLAKGQGQDVAPPTHGS